MNDASLHGRQRPHVPHHFWQAFEPVTDEDEHVLDTPLSGCQLTRTSRGLADQSFISSRTLSVIREIVSFDTDAP